MTALLANLTVSALATALMVVGIVLIPQAANAAAVTDTIDDIVYEADDANVAAGATITGYTGTDTTVVIPGNVTLAGQTYAVTAVGPQSFSSKGLTSVTIPGSVITIGTSAFNHNPLTSVVLPESLITIGMFAFNENSLMSLTIPDSVTTIGRYAFRQNALTNVVIPDAVTTVGEYAFDGNGLSSLTLGSSVQTIDTYAFMNNELTSITIPDSVTLVGNHAFNLNPLLTEVFFEGNAPVASGQFQSFGTSATLFYQPGATGFTTPRWNGYKTFPTSHTVAFEGQGGSETPDATVDHGDVVNAPGTPVRDGFVFTGWFIGDADAPYDFASPVTSDLVLYASWEEGSPGGDDDPTEPGDSDEPGEGDDSEEPGESEESVESSDDQIEIVRQDLGATESNTGGTDLPATGLAASTPLWATLGATLVLVGLLTLLLARRRRNDATLVNG